MDRLDVIKERFQSIRTDGVAEKFAGLFVLRRLVALLHQQRLQKRIIYKKKQFTGT